MRGEAEQWWLVVRPIGPALEHDPAKHGSVSHRTARRSAYFAFSRSFPRNALSTYGYASRRWPLLFSVVLATDRPYFTLFDKLKLKIDELLSVHGRAGRAGIILRTVAFS